jgi:hypothetical protein
MTTADVLTLHLMEDGRMRPGCALAGAQKGVAGDLLWAMLWQTSPAIRHSTTSFYKLRD